MSEELRRFLEGDVVEVQDCAELHNWHNWERAVGQRSRLTREDANRLNKGHSIILFKNKYGINFYPEVFKIVKSNIWKGGKRKHD